MLELEPELSTTLTTVTVVVERLAALKFEEALKLDLGVVVKSACMAVPLSLVTSAEIGVTGESIEDSAASWATIFQGLKRVRMKRR